MPSLISGEENFPFEKIEGERELRRRQNFLADGRENLLCRHIPLEPLAVRAKTIRLLDVFFAIEKRGHREPGHKRAGCMGTSRG
jgi:hypothetical protein